jgi:hypothetical protein
MIGIHHDPARARCSGRGWVYSHNAPVR